jgi:hypothetical protein
MVFEGFYRIGRQNVVALAIRQGDRLVINDTGTQ